MSDTDDQKNKSAPVPVQNLPADVQVVQKEVEAALAQSVAPEQRGAISQRIMRAVVRFTRVHRGPLPDGETITIYNREIPNGGDRLMKQVENQAAHRQKLEEFMVRDQASARQQGQWISCVLCLFFGWISYSLGMNGHDVLAGMVATTTIIGVITVFVLGRRPPSNRTRDDEGDDADDDAHDDSDVDDDADVDDSKSTPALQKKLPNNQQHQRRKHKHR
jgi:uncharacterized membrane protein